MSANITSEVDGLGSSPPKQKQPALPPRQHQPTMDARPRTSEGLNGQPVPDTSHLAPPPQRLSQLEVQSGPSLIDYARDLRKLTGYLIPYPKPHLPDVPPEDIPQRFLVWTPPAPPFLYHKPTDGKREGITHWTKRHWYKELREAKMRDPPKGKTTKWKRLKWRGTKATAWGISKVKSSNLEFLNRIAGMQDQADLVADDVYSKTLSPEELVLVYPSGSLGDHGVHHDAMQQEFIASMLRTKKKAYKDSVLAAILFPPALVVDTIAVPVWPFGGLAEIDAVWLYASLRGAKTSRSVTKRLTSGDLTSKKAAKKLDFTLVPSSCIDILERYLAAACHKRDPALFPVYVSPPGETQCLEAIGWSPSNQDQDMGTGLAAKAMSWDDEQFEITQVKDDLKDVFGKGAKEWAKWIKLYRKKPEKAAKR